jgi:heterodisulfide reductase subunit C/nitrate reductase gamma subunit
MFYTIALYASLSIFAAGLIYKISNWFRFRIGPEAGSFSTARRVAAAARGVATTIFSARIIVLAKVLVTDVLWQKWLLKRNFYRWSAHMFIYAGFMLLLLMHGLDKLIAPVLFKNYYSTLNPFMFLRNLFALIVLIGLGMVVCRRIFSKSFRARSTVVDYWAVGILAVIMVSGIALESAKIVSWSAFRMMAADYAGLKEDQSEELQALGAYWVQYYGLVAPDLKAPFDQAILQQGEETHAANCAQCHSRPQSAFLSYGASVLLRPAAPALDRARAPDLLWYLHFLACFAGLAYLPFSKFFHLFATPIYLMARRAMEKGEPDPANAATVQAMALDACTHCGDCTSRCSVAVAFNEIPNPTILPSEKLAAFRRLLSGRGLNKSNLIRLQEGSHICTDCHRCTDICPIGIDLEALWLNLKRQVADFGHPKPEAWARQRSEADFSLVPRAAPGPAPLIVGTAFMEDVPGTMAAGSFASCFECQNCTNVCPVVGMYASPRKVLGLLPHEIMHCLTLKQKDLVLGAGMLWECLTCYVCQEQCPQGVWVTDVLYQLKNLALKQLKDEA